MQLSKKAHKDLKAILRTEIGEDGLRQFTDEGINDLGVRLLYLTALCLKVRTKKLMKRSSEEQQRKIRNSNYTFLPKCFSIK